MRSIPEQKHAALDKARQDLHIQQIPQHDLVGRRLLQHADDGRREALEVVDQLPSVRGLVVPGQSLFSNTVSSHTLPRRTRSS